MINLVHPMKNDLEEVFAFQVECDISEFGEPDSSREDLEELWSTIDLAQDAWLARDPAGRLIGYACVSSAAHGLQMDLFISQLTSPAGLEDELMRTCKARASEILTNGKMGGEVTLTGYASITNPRLQGTYTRAGFTEVKRHYNMAIEIRGDFPAPDWPAGITLSTFDPAEEFDLYTFMEAAFARPGREPAPFEFWHGLLLRGGRYDPALFLVAREGGRIVGAALSYDEEVGGWVRQLAVATDQRGRGLGSLLLRQLYNTFARRGVKRVALAVSAENENALRVYERAGMHRSREFIEYRKSLET